MAPLGRVWTHCHRAFRRHSRIQLISMSPLSKAHRPACFPFPFPNFLPSPSRGLSPIYTPPLQSNCRGQKLTSPSPSRYSPTPIPIPSRPRSTRCHSPDVFELSRLPDTKSLFDQMQISTEILRHGKHGQQTTPNQSSPSQQPSNGIRSPKAPATQATQPQLAQAYYNNDMPSQGLVAGNGMFRYVCDTRCSPVQAMQGNCKHRMVPARARWSRQIIGKRPRG